MFTIDVFFLKHFVANKVNTCLNRHVKSYIYKSWDSAILISKHSITSESYRHTSISKHGYTWLYNQDILVHRLPITSGITSKLAYLSVKPYVTIHWHNTQLYAYTSTPQLQGLYVTPRSHIEKRRIAHIEWVVYKDTNGC